MLTRKFTTDVASRPSPTADQSLTSIFVCACSLPSVPWFRFAVTCFYRRINNPLFPRSYPIHFQRSTYTPISNITPESDGNLYEGDQLVSNTPGSSLILVEEHNIHWCDTRPWRSHYFFDRDLVDGRYSKSVFKVLWAPPPPLSTTFPRIVIYLSKWWSHSFPVWSIDADRKERPCPISQLDNLGWLWSEDFVFVVDDIDVDCWV